MADLSFIIPDLDINVLYDDGGRPSTYQLRWLERPEPEEPPGPPPPLYTEPPLFSQRDPRWANKKLGHGTSTIGGFGCLVTAAAMMLSYVYQTEMTPDKVNDALEANDGFTGPNGNLMYFAKVWEVWPVLEGAGLHDWLLKPANISILDQALDDGAFALTRVDFKPQTAAADEHWVLLWKRASDGVYVINDPWLLPEQQQTMLLPPAYCSTGWDAARAIYKVSLYKPREDNA